MQGKRATDWVKLILGIWLVISPWFLAPLISRPEWSIPIIGIAAVLFSIWALAQPASNVPEWWNVALGVFLFFTPWLFRFFHVEALAWNAWIVGVALVILAFAGMPARTHLTRHPGV